MKKGRPAHTLHVLCRDTNAAELRDLVFRSTGTLGVREQRVTRYAQPRRMATAEVDGEPIRVKIGPFRTKAEFDDVAAAANRLNLPPAVVARRAEAAAEG